MVVLAWTIFFLYLVIRVINLIATWLAEPPVDYPENFLPRWQEKDSPMTELQQSSKTTPSSQQPFDRIRYH